MLVEALASGTAVISTTTGGISEVISHNKTGLLVPPIKPNELKSSIVKLIENPELRETIATKGKQTAQTHDWSIICDKFIALYQKTKVVK